MKFTEFTKKRILFFTQTMGLTGSEVVLGNILGCMDRSKYDFAIVIMGYAGKLLDALPQDSKIIHYSKFLKSKRRNVIFLLRVFFRILSAKIFKRQVNIPDAILKSSRFFEYLESLEYDIWYFNTIVLLDPMEYARLRGINSVLHVHELEQMYYNITESYFKSLIVFPRQVIANSPASAKIIKFLRKRNDVDVVFPGIEYQEMKGKMPASGNRVKGRFKWIASGTTDPNKNPVMFVEIARCLLEEGLEVDFEWVGYSGENIYQKLIIEMINDYGISNYVRFLPHFSVRSEYIEFLYDANAMVITSFRESFSIVGVEAIYCGKPVVSFLNGGVDNYLNPVNGVSIDAYSLTGFVNGAKKIMSDIDNYEIEKMRASVNQFERVTQYEKWDKAVSGMSI